MVETTISSLLSTGAKFIRAEFEQIRATNPHAGEMGKEVEQVLIRFLNQRMPKRFLSTSGFVIDNKSALSKQTDVIIYDAFSSAVYRSSETLQIVPIETTAAVIEVKSRLNKAELRDGFEKIKSIRELEARPLSDVDQSATRSELTVTRQFGVIFGFDCDTTLETLAGNFNELLHEYDSSIWPDLVVVLDKGLISFGCSFPGQQDGIPGGFMRSGLEDVGPPMYVHQVVHFDKEFTLNRFWILLLSHLTFFARRNGMPQFDAALKDNAKEVLTIEAFQFNKSLKLIPVPKTGYGPQELQPVAIAIALKKKTSEILATIQYIPWQDGAILRAFGKIPIQVILGATLPNKKVMVLQNPVDHAQLTSVLDLTEKEFRTWFRPIRDKTPFRAEIIEPKT